MVVLCSEKNRKQVQALLQERTEHVKISYLYVPFLYWLSDGVLLGKVHNNKFYLIYPNRSMGSRLPLRFFIGKFINVDNKTVIRGRFRYHSFVYIIFLIACLMIIIPDFMSFINGFQGILPVLIRSLIVFLIFAVCILIGTSKGKRNNSEKETIDFIRKIIEDE